MSKCLIISRFKEDISWLNSYKEFKLYIYNKGDEVAYNNCKNIINIPNLGRESHTWLYHIVNNYNKLEDINIFLQGSIDDLGCMAFENPNEYCKNINKYGFAVKRYGLLGPLHWENNIDIQKDSRYKKDWEEGKISKSDIGFRKFAKSIFPEIPIFVATSYGGCFALKKETIHKYDIEFYRHLLKILGKHINPIEGHYMERLWCYMFTKNKPLMRSIKDVFLTKYERILSKK
tara:strand:- start:68 stop:763 length:696 start_codon:yes stop_codon:yes gene_type:complete